MSEAVLELLQTEIIPGGFKRCYRCKQIKPFNKFCKKKTGKNGLNGWCIECKRESQREYRQNPKVRLYQQEYRREYNQRPEVKARYREYSLRTKYGITVNEENNMLKQQNNKCCICENEFVGIPFIDHVHRFDKNGKELPCRKEDVRGLLCQKCNSAIGLFNENKTTIKNALQYLEKWDMEFYKRVV